jgi:hypothetical protein
MDICDNIIAATRNRGGWRSPASAFGEIEAIV